MTSRTPTSVASGQPTRYTGWVQRSGRLLAPPKPDQLAPRLHARRAAGVACLAYALVSLPNIAHTLIWLGAARRARGG